MSEQQPFGGVSSVPVTDEATELARSALQQLNRSRSGGDVYQLGEPAVAQAESQVVAGVNWTLLLNVTSQNGGAQQLWVRLWQREWLDGDDACKLTYSGTAHP